MPHVDYDRNKEASIGQSATPLCCCSAIRISMKQPGFELTPLSILQAFRVPASRSSAEGYTRPWHGARFTTKPRPSCPLLNAVCAPVTAPIDRARGGWHNILSPIMIPSDVAEAADVILVRPALGGLQGHHHLICCCWSLAIWLDSLGLSGVARGLDSVLVVSEWATLQS
jgi:hypothetical protein